MLGRVPDKEPCVAKDTRADQVNGRENTLVCLPCAREWKRTSSLRVVGEVEPQEWNTNNQDEWLDYPVEAGAELRLHEFVAAGCPNPPTPAEAFDNLLRYEPWTESKVI